MLSTREELTPKLELGPLGLLSCELGNFRNLGDPKIHFVAFHAKTTGDKKRGACTCVRVCARATL